MAEMQDMIHYFLDEIDDGSFDGLFWVAFLHASSGLSLSQELEKESVGMIFYLSG